MNPVKITSLSSKTPKIVLNNNQLAIFEIYNIGLIKSNSEYLKITKKDFFQVESKISWNKNSFYLGDIDLEINKKNHKVCFFLNHNCNNIITAFCPKFLMMRSDQILHLIILSDHNDSFDFEQSKVNKLAGSIESEQNKYHHNFWFKISPGKYDLELSNKFERHTIRLHVNDRINDFYYVRKIKTNLQSS